MYERDPLTVDVELRLARSEQACARRPDYCGTRVKVVDSEADVMNTTPRMRLEEILNRGIFTARLKELDLRITEIHKSEPDTLALIDSNVDDSEAENLL